MHRWIWHVKKPWEGLESTFGQRSTINGGQQSTSVNGQHRLGSLGLVRIGSARVGSVRLDSVKLGSAWFNSAQLGSTR